MIRAWKEPHSNAEDGDQNENETLEAAMAEALLHASKGNGKQGVASIKVSSLHHAT